MTPAVTPLIWKPASALGLPISTEVKSGTCAAHAASYYVAQRIFRATGKYLPLSRRSLHAAAKKIDGMKKRSPGDDDLDAIKSGAYGTTLGAVAVATTKFGICLDEFFPDDVTLDDPAYSDHGLMTPAAIADARGRAMGERFLFTGENPSIDSLKQLIREYGGVVLVLNGGHEWVWDPSAGKISWDPRVIMPTGTLLPPSRPDTTSPAPHTVYACAYDEARLLFPNSWSRAWGADGWGAIGENYSPHILGGLVFR